MNKKIFWLIVIVLILLVQSGCWNRREMETLGYVTLMIIDKNEAGEIELYLGIAKPSGLGGGETGKKAGDIAATRLVVLSRGRTVFEAIRNASMETPRTLFFGQEMGLIITERAAKEDIGDLLDIILREHEFRRLITLYITKSPAIEAALSQPELELLLAKELEGIADKSTLVGKFPNVDINEFSKTMASDVPNPVAPLLVIKEGLQQKKFLEDNSKQVPVTPFIQGMAVFKGESFAGELDTISTRGYLFVKNKIKSPVLVITSPGLEHKLVSMEIVKSKADIETKIIDDVPSINVKVKVEVNIVEEMASEDLTKKEAIKEVEKRTAEVIRNEIQKGIDAAQLDLRVDFFGFGKEVHRAHKEYWKKHKAQWGRIFPDVRITTDVEAKLRRTGLETKPLSVK